MIPALVFSRNRACQLDALLASLEANAPGIFDLTVLYRADNDDFADAYSVLRSDRRVRWQRELVFQKQVIDWLSYTQAIGAHICCFTDDDICYRPLLFPPPMGDVLAFSLRLGRGAADCYPHRRAQQAPTFTDAGTHLTWDWRHADGDWGYVPSLDGNVFARDVFRAMLAGSDKWDQWTNPNTLEDALCAGVHQFGGTPDTQGLYLPMGCFPESVLVNVPANIVTTTHRNRHAYWPTATPEALNEMFLSGYRIDWQSMDWSLVNGAHAEIPLVLTKELT